MCPTGSYCCEWQPLIKSIETGLVWKKKKVKKLWLISLLLTAMPSNPFSPPQKYSPPLDDALIAGLGLGRNDPDLPASSTSSGSMILYRLADDPRTSRSSSFLLPPQFKHRFSSTLSYTTLDSNSPLIGPTHSALRGLVPYLYDPSLDSSQPIDDEDRLHDPTITEDFKRKNQSFSWRGLSNIAVLLFLISAFLSLFILYPVWTFVRDRARNLNIFGNTRINGTG